MHWFAQVTVDDIRLCVCVHAMNTIWHCNALPWNTFLLFAVRWKGKRSSWMLPNWGVRVCLRVQSLPLLGPLFQQSSQSKQAPQTLISFSPWPPSLQTLAAHTHTHVHVQIYKTHIHNSLESKDEQLAWRMNHSSTEKQTTGEEMNKWVELSNSLLNSRNDPLFCFNSHSKSKGGIFLLTTSVWNEEGVGVRWPLDMSPHSRLAPTPHDLPSYLAQILAFHLGQNLGELGLYRIFIPPSPSSLSLSHTHTYTQTHTHTRHSRPPPSPGSIFESQMSSALTYKGDNNEPHTTLVSALLSSKHFTLNCFQNSLQEKKKVPFCTQSTHTHVDLWSLLKALLYNKNTPGCRVWLLATVCVRTEAKCWCLQFKQSPG